MKIIRRQANNPIAKAFAQARDSLESEIEFRKLNVVEELLQFMKREGINRSQLATYMGVGSSRITALLNGSANLTIDTLVRAGRAIGADLAQTFVPQGNDVHWTFSPKNRTRKNNILSLAFEAKKIAQAPTPSLQDHQTAICDAEDAA